MKETALLYARTAIFKRRLAEAREIVKRALSIPVVSYVSFSTGKDSTVVYGLAREANPDIPAVWSDDEWYLPESLEYVTRLQQAGLDVRQIRTNAWHAEWFTVAGDFDGIPDYARQQGWGLAFLGLRQDENSYRRLHLRKLGPLFRAESDGFWHCNPIGQWSVMDVWAYIHSAGLDYNRAYDKLAAMGIPPDKQRIGPLAVERVLGYGQLVILKKGWPDLYNKYVARYPEARSYV